MTDDGVTRDEAQALVTAMALRLAELEGVDVDGHPGFIIERTRRELRQPSGYRARVAVSPRLGSWIDDCLAVVLVRVTESVNNDGSLITSQSVPVSRPTTDQTSEQGD